jgi:hypothetical protein
MTNPPTDTTANAGAGDALGDVLTPEQRQMVSDCADDSGIGNEPELVEIIRDLAGRLVTVERERDLLYPSITAAIEHGKLGWQLAEERARAARWLAEHEKGAEVPGWVDEAINHLPKR